MADRRHHRKDPSEGGWDPTILKAPDSHKASGKKHHRHRSRRRRRKVLKVVVIVLAVVLAILLAAGVAFALYMRSLDEKMAISDPKGELANALADTPLNDSFYVLLLGSDMREYTVDSYGGMPQEEIANMNAQNGPNATGYSDVMMLVRVDVQASKVSLLTIPRDTPWTNAEGKTAKINSAFKTGGAPAAVKAVEDLTGVRISHYAEVTGAGLEKLVDSVGGIVVDVPVEIHASTSTTHERVDLEAGQQRVNGAEAMALANFRKIYAKGEYSRQVGARQVVTGLLNEIRSKSVAELPGVVSDAVSCVKTDLTTGELIDLVRMMGAKMKVYQGTGPYEGDWDYWVGYPETLTKGADWFCFVNESGWKRATSTLESGEDPSTLNYDGDLVHYADQPQETWSQGPVQPPDAPKDS